MSSGYSPADAAASSAVATVLDGHDGVNALVLRCSDRAMSPHARLDHRQVPRPRDTAPPASPGLLTLVRRALMRWRVYHGPR